MATSPYVMRLDLHVLDHLGLNLYSNVSAVISEAVANAWDADAEIVKIDVDLGRGTIAITDDGNGMTTQEINEKYLLVGYRRRESEAVTTPKHRRHVMGRKGIGKLSLFSIADEIEIHTVKMTESGPDRNAFVMKTEEIRAQMQTRAGEYAPEALDPARIKIATGTRIELRDLKTRITRTTENSLRKRLARRFAVIGPENRFRVEINGREVGVEDREFFRSIEYLWSIGDVGERYEALCARATKMGRIDGSVDDDNGWSVSGWVGTFDEQRSIEDEHNTITILAWGKLVHEDILKDIHEGGLFSKYLIGEIHADFIDKDDDDDITTSDRQRLKEDDSRYLALKRFVQDSVLRIVGNSWRDWRREGAVNRAMENEVIKEWMETLGGDAKEKAKKLFGKIGTATTQDEDTRREIYRHAVLAFERLRYRDALAVIDEMPEGATLTALERAFTTIDELEAAQFHQISKGRLEIIEKFVDIATSQKEKIVQKYLFDHLWLLDPSWERVTTSPRMEESVAREFDAVEAGLTEDERRGRVDLRYFTMAGKHVIVELKKYDAHVKAGALLDQMKKYRDALRKCLDRTDPGAPHHLEEVAVLGQMPGDLDEERVQMLRVISARLLTYDSLVIGAQNAYRQYLESQQEVKRINEILDRL